MYQERRLGPRNNTRTQVAQLKNQFKWLASSFLHKYLCPSCPRPPKCVLVPKGLWGKTAQNLLAIWFGLLIIYHKLLPGSFVVNVGKISILGT